jgi:hypothetical protein
MASNGKAYTAWNYPNPRGKLGIMRTSHCLAVLLVTGLIAGPAAAQDATNLNESNIRSGAPKAPGAKQRSEAPPPSAVPGAVARPGTVAPMERSAADLPPTEGLFDAINRGDIVAARDALSRGADLDGTNLLGLTPLELSVDLGRNDISFLLLSMRGSGGGSRASGAPSQAAAAPAVAPAVAAAQRRQAEKEARAQEAANAKAARQATQAAAQRQAPALFAGNGGTAVPSAGFLGFDPHR